MLLSTRPHFPAELQGLEQLRLHKGKDPEHPSYMGYYFALMEKTKWALLYAEKAHAAAVVYCWLEHLSKTLHMPEFFTMYSRNTDKIVSLVVKHQLTPDLAQHADAQPLLASLCLTRVALSSQGEPDVRTHGISGLLAQWTGCTPEDTILASMPDMVNHLYGPGAWELYGVDAMNATQVQTLFYSLNLPVVIGKNKLPRDPMESVLPVDIS